MSMAETCIKNNKTPYQTIILLTKKLHFRNLDASSVQPFKPRKVRKSPRVILVNELAGLLTLCLNRPVGLSPPPEAALTPPWTFEHLHLVPSDHETGSPLPHPDYCTRFCNGRLQTAAPTSHRQLEPCGWCTHRTVPHGTKRIDGETQRPSG